MPSNEGLPREEAGSLQEGKSGIFTDSERQKRDWYYCDVKMHSIQWNMYETLSEVEIDNNTLQHAIAVQYLLFWLCITDQYDVNVEHTDRF